MPIWLAETPEPDLVTVWFGFNDWDSGMRGEQFGEMAVVDAFVETMRAGQLKDPSAGRRAESSGRGSPSVAVHQPVGSSFDQSASQSPGASFAHPEQSDRLARGQDVSDPAGQDLNSLLVSCRQRQPLSHWSRLTKSLSS